MSIMAEAKCIVHSKSSKLCTVEAARYSPFNHAPNDVLATCHDGVERVLTSRCAPTAETTGHTSPHSLDGRWRPIRELHIKKPKVSRLSLSQLDRNRPHPVRVSDWEESHARENLPIDHVDSRGGSVLGRVQPAESGASRVAGGRSFPCEVTRLLSRLVK